MKSYKVVAKITQKGITFIRANTIQDAWQKAEEMSSDEFTIQTDEVEIEEVEE